MYAQSYLTVSDMVLIIAELWLSFPESLRTRALATLVVVLPSRI